MGSIMRVEAVTDDIENAVSEMKLRGLPVFAAVISDTARSLTDCDFSQGGAVMIGNEGNGLSDYDASLADIAAMAAGIIMWELSKTSE